MKLQSHPTTLSAVTAVALAAALALAGCNANPAELAAGSVGSTPTTTAEAEPVTSDEPAEPVEEDLLSEPEPVDEEPAPLTPTGAQCLVGNWLVDNSAFEVMMSAFSGTAVDSISGSLMVTFLDDGTTTTTYDAWTHTITVADGTATVVKNGADSGTYSVGEDGEITINETETTAVTEMQIQVDGQTMSLTEPPGPGVFTDATFTCSGDELTITAAGETSVLYREH